MEIKRTKRQEKLMVAGYIAIVVAVLTIATFALAMTQDSWETYPRSWLYVYFGGIFVVVIGACLLFASIPDKPKDIECKMTGKHKESG